VLSWWLVEDNGNIVWDESFAKVVLYACGMAPEFSREYLADLVRIMPKREEYVLLDGTPEQSVAGQINRGKFRENMPAREREQKLLSADKYREVAHRLSIELHRSGCAVDREKSGIVV
jgi:hypothetical protein